MAKRKSRPRLPIAFPDGAQKIFFTVCSFALALIILLAFFEKAGDAGAALLGIFSVLAGKGVVLLPLFFVLAGVGFWGVEKEKKSSVFLLFLAFLFGVSGMIATIARAQGLNAQEFGGFLGFLLSWPLFAAFGFWVSVVIFAALLMIGVMLLWQTFPHEKFQEVVRAPAMEKVRKIFEPKFEVNPLQEHGEPAIRIPKDKKSDVPVQIEEINTAFSGDYKLPPTNLLDEESGLPNAGDVQLASAIIKKTLQNFGIPVEITEVNIGPTVTQYALKPSEGIKLSRITGLSNDLALALAAHPIRIEAPIPGRALVGIEVPNKARTQVRLRPLVESEQFKTSPSPLLLALGRDVSGNQVFADLARMPHLLIAGATGTGKTIGLNNILLSLLYRNSPHQLRLILVDPKRVEFPVYNDLPHLLAPVILDTQKTINVLRWLIKEMERRFQVFSEVRARDIKGYHALCASRQSLESIPYIVVIIDELADFMASRGKDMEGMIVRLAQMARAVGIHLILATQRPSVEVITGLIKANITSRIAFQVASQVDSRTILDAGGAEKLLGQGDLLFVSAEISKPKRAQGAYVADREVKKVVGWISRQAKDFVREEIEEDELSQGAGGAFETESFDKGGDDPLYEEARRVAIEYQKASASLLQRRLKVGYARAARLLDILESKGVVGPGEGAKPREVFIKREGEEPAVEFVETQAPKEEKQEQSRWFSP